MKEQKSILIIEDSTTVLKMIKKYFEMAGYLVQACASTEEAYKILNNAKIDLVICDIVIESKTAQTGYHILKYVKKSSDLKHIPVFLMTDRRNTANASATALRLGACAFLEKPFKMEELEEMVKKSLSDPSFVHNK